MQLNNNTILITGGSAGIGLAMATAMHELGNRVIICGRNEQRLSSVISHNSGLHTIACDISVSEQQAALVKRVVDKFPKLNVLINNAGTQYRADFRSGEFSFNHIREEINTNLSAQIELTARMLPQLAAQNSSSIIFMGSALAKVPKKSTPVYCATKSALHSFVRTLRYQLEGSTTEIFEVIPDLVDTAMTQHNSRKKISPEQLTQEVIKGLQKGIKEIRIGRTPLLFALHRFFPSVAYRLLRNE
ncbi:MAG: SDR family NAD(P)-dependent oxidoreductase [Pseudomonadota bacterium]